MCFALLQTSCAPGLLLVIFIPCTDLSQPPTPPAPRPCSAPAATKLDADSLEAIAGDAPSASLPLDQLVGAPLADVMVAVGMQPSKAAVRRMIKVGRASLGGWVVGSGWGGRVCKVAGRQSSCCWR